MWLLKRRGRERAEGITLADKEGVGMIMTLSSGLHWDFLHSSVDDGFVSGNVVSVVEGLLKGRHLCG